MAIVMGFDIHREQITYDALDNETGELIFFFEDDDASRRMTQEKLPPGGKPEDASADDGEVVGRCGH